MEQSELKDLEQAAASTDEQAAEEVLLEGAESEILAIEGEAEAQVEVPAEVMFIEDDRLVSIVESVLFASDRPVSLASLKAVFEGTSVRTKDIQRALDRLASTYAASDRGVSLEEITGGYQLRTKIDNAEFLKRNVKVRPFKLSGPALEVISIVAYKQPITKPEIDQIRGVESGHLVRALMERGLVTFGEKSDLPGRPMQYLTTRKFLEIFGLRNLEELPSLSEIDQLLPEGIGEDEDKETLSDLTEELSQQVGSNYSAAEDELLDISESLKVIDSTSEFFEQEKRRAKEQKDRDRAQDIRERVAVGESVDDKDVRWLERYEKALAQAEAEAFAKEAARAAESVAGQLEALSDESSEQGSTLSSRDAESTGLNSADFESADDLEESEISDSDSGSIADIEADSSSDDQDPEIEFEAEGSV